MIELINQLNTRKYNPLHTPSEEQKTFTIGGKLVGSLGNFIAITGIPKSGKSTYLSAIIASALHPADFFTMKLQTPKDRHKICLFDTESSEYDFYRQINRIKNFCNYNTLPKIFDAYSVREDDCRTVLSYLSLYLEQNNDCSVMVIDGLLDLVINYNDETESRLLIQLLKQLTKKHNVLIITVIHLGKRDLQTVGHLGSASDRYAQSTLIVEKDKDQDCFVLSSKYMRSDADFEPISIKYSHGEYHSYNYEPSIKENFKKKKQ